jgi:hypothetical protein
MAALPLAPVRPAAAQNFTPVTDEQKSDVLVLRNGDILTGDLREMSRGMVTFKTDAASTIYVKWPRVVSATSAKVFEIDVDDGRVLVGSVAAPDSAYRLAIRQAADTVELPIESVVKMVRIKKTVFERIDGSLDAGVNFTQQNDKVDLSLTANVRYDVARHRVRLDFNGTYSRQDSVSPIERRNVSLQYSRILRRRWSWSANIGQSRNTQLGLESAWTIGTGPGRLLISSNKVVLGTWIGLNYRKELYVDSDARSVVPLSLTTDLEWFTWTGMSTDVSSRLVVAPILNDDGRWRINFTASLRREILSNLYLNFGVSEIYDSKPPADANKNDFSFTSSIGWSF